MSNEENEVAERTIKIVGEIFKVTPEKIGRETSFTEDLRAKSIDIIAFLAALEGEFKIRIPATEVQGNKTIGQAIDYLVNKLKV